MLHIRHLTKYYTKSKPIISDMNLSFPSTGLNIIVGKSGCGKTTLLNMIGTMDQDYIGSIELDGVELSRLNNKKIAEYRSYDSSYIFQLNSLFEHLTVRQNIQLVLDLQQKDVDIDALLERVGLKGFANKKVKFLSGGERQRVGIARAIAKDSKIILADEPTSALDSKNGHKILQLLKEISKEKLVIVVTHDTKKAFVYADRIIKLVDGRVVEDKVINEIDKPAQPVVRKKPRGRVLFPIFMEQFRKSIIINLFVLLLVSAALGVFNIAKEQAKIKAEYDEFYDLQKDPANQFKEFEFDPMRALLTQEANDVNQFQVLKAGENMNKFHYFRNVAAIQNNLDDTDLEKLSSILKPYDVNTFDANYGGLIIEGISNRLRGQVTIMGTQRYWFELQRTTYTHLIHQEGNTYDIKYGALPKADNEILITDTIADNYLRNNRLDASDLSIMLDQDLTIHDIYGIGYRDLSTSSNGPSYDTGVTTYHTVPKTYKIVGIIDTHQLQYYDYRLDGNTYALAEGIYTQIGTASYMNELYMQPYGFVVLNHKLDAADEYTFTDFPVKMNRVLYRGQNLSSNPIEVNVFQGYNDYRGILGYEDNLQIDSKRRLYIKNDGLSELEGNQIIINRQLLERITGETWSESRILSSFESTIQGEEIALMFDTLLGMKEITFEIAGISKNGYSMFYVSTEVFHQLQDWNTPVSHSAVTIGLEGVTSKERLELIEELYRAGYVLSPKNRVPGAYLEFVPTQGEIEEIDEEGYSEKKNISLYHLFSSIYNTNDMDDMNATLEVIGSIANFVLFLSIILSLGFIYLKERRQKLNIMKLSQIGVSSKSIIWMNVLTYLVVAVLIGAVGYFATVYAIGYINSIFTLSIGSSIQVFRFRIIPTNTTVITAVLSVLITSLIGIIASAWIVLKSRR